MDKPGTDSSLKDVDEYKCMAEVEEEYEWFGALPLGFSDCAMCDAGIGECTVAVNDDVYDASNEQLIKIHPTVVIRHVCE